MRPELAALLRSFDADKGDRIDPVATVCRALYLRVELCPCQHLDRFRVERCRQCQNDQAAIEAAWDATEPEKR